MQVKSKNINAPIYNRFFNHPFDASLRLAIFSNNTASALLHGLPVHFCMDAKGAGRGVLWGDIPAG